MEIYDRVLRPVYIKIVIIFFNYDFKVVNLQEKSNNC